MPKRKHKKKESKERLKKESSKQSHYFDADHIVAYLYKEERERHEAVKKTSE